MKTKRLLFAPRNLGAACLLALSVLAGTGSAQASGFLFRFLIPNSVATAATADLCSGSFTQDSPGTYSITVPAGCPVSATLNGAGGGNGGGGGGGNGYFGGGGGSDGGNYYPGGGGGGGSNYASAALSDASLSDTNGCQGGAGYPNTPTAGANASATLTW